MNTRTEIVHFKYLCQILHNSCASHIHVSLTVKILRLWRLRKTVYCYEAVEKYIWFGRYSSLDRCQ